MLLLHTGDQFTKDERQKRKRKKTATLSQRQLECFSGRSELDEEQPRAAPMIEAVRSPDAAPAHGGARARQPATLSPSALDALLTGKSKMTEHWSIGSCAHPTAPRQEIDIHRSGHSLAPPIRSFPSPIIHLPNLPIGRNGKPASSRRATDSVTSNRAHVRRVL